MNARAISILLGLALLGASGAMAQEPSDPMAARLSAERVSDVAVGDYTAADDINFSILPYGDKYLLRFDDSPENFVLSSDRVALGGRELQIRYRRAGAENFRLGRGHALYPGCTRRPARHPHR